jgi:3-isopropylmalate/(R)-2-methylmalate dehydratase small subunit
MQLRGRVFKYGANVDTDVIIPARYLNTSDPAELAKHCMEDIDPEFASKVQPGDIIVATTNFGCGSSREHAPLAIKASGVSCVIAESFARIFFRNAINIGLPILECAEAVRETEAGDVLSVDLIAGTIINETRGKTFQAKPYPDFMLEIIRAGGLINYTKKRLEAARAAT